MAHTILANARVPHDYLDYFRLKGTSWRGVRRMVVAQLRDHQMMHQLRAASLTAFTAVAIAASSIWAQTVDQGVALHDAGKSSEARTVLLPFGDRDAVAAFHLGQIMMEANDDGKAADWFEKAVKMNPKSAVYYDWLGRSYGRQAQRANKLKLPLSGSSR